MKNNQLIESIVNYRKEKHISQRQLAALCGIPQSTIGRMENGSCEPNMQTLQKIIEVLGLELSCRPIDHRSDYLKKWDGLTFFCYWKDEPVSEVHVSGTKVHVKRFSKNPLKQIFFAEYMDIYRLSLILEGRCWERNRSDIDEYLKKLKLSYYDPLEIVKRTRGVSYNDFLWFQFMGEDLTWKDVAPRRFRNV